MIEVVRMVVGEFLTCSYLVRAKGSRKALVIDPGAEGERILGEIARRELEVETVLNTHGHVDHIGANEAIKKAFPEAELVIGEGDGPMLSSAIRNLSALFLRRVKSPAADRALREGDEVTVGGAKGEVLETPGHTTGGISLYFSAQESGGAPVVFSGDALFQMGVGRTDFPGGNMDVLVRSVREKLFSLPGETIVYPGHGEPTLVGEEARSNPFAALPTRG
ncbi:MAG: MBL fold metallo-hydrolase [Planctomycetota bacterium]